VHMHRQYINIVYVYSSRVSWTVTFILELQIQKCSITMNIELHGLNSTCLKIDIIRLRDKNVTWILRVWSHILTLGGKNGKFLTEQDR